MKKLRKNNIIINAATSGGTTYYKITLNMLYDFADNADNLFYRHRVKSRGWSAFDFGHNLFGSLVIDDVLYLCSTDGKDISVNGELTDPEEALSNYKLTSLKDYIKQGTEEEIRRNLGEYELKDFDLNREAYKILQSGADFTDLVKSAQELDLI